MQARRGQHPAVETLCPQKEGQTPVLSPKIGVCPSFSKIHFLSFDPKARAHGDGELLLALGGCAPVDVAAFVRRGLSIHVFVGLEAPRRRCALDLTRIAPAEVNRSRRLSLHHPTAASLSCQGERPLATR